jgi:hypothetical protein
VVVEGTSGSPEPSGPSLAWLRKRLAAPDTDLHGCLLDVLHALPGATIEDGVLSWSVDRRLGTELPGVLDQMTDLGAALSEWILPAAARPVRDAASSADGRGGASLGVRAAQVTSSASRRDGP